MSTVMEAVLAAMLFLIQPGKSVYSQVVVEPDAPAPCSDPYSLLCLPPRWSEAHGAHTVAESWEQGVIRYAVIAKALAEVVDMRRKDDKRRWSTPRRELWRYTLAMAYAESGFRRDVHEGLGKASRGDCKWRKVVRERKDGIEHETKERIPGSCRSHCLAQLQLGIVTTSFRTVEGYGPLDLVGADLAATKRCFEVAVRVVDGAYHWCSRWGPRPLASCVINRYGGGMLDMNDKRIRERIRWLNKLHHAPVKIDARAREVLGLDRVAGDGRGGAMLHSAP